MALVDPAVVATLEKEFGVREAESNDTSIVTARAMLAAARGLPTEAEATFALGLVLVFSRRSQNLNEGVQLLGTLLQQGYNTSEVIFYQCVGLMNAGKYRACHQQLVALVQSEPTNERAAALLHIYKARVSADAYPGFLIYAGLAVVVLGVGYLAYSYFTRPAALPSGAASSSGRSASTYAAPVAAAAPPIAASSYRGGTSSSASSVPHISSDSRATLTRLSRGGV